MATGLSGTRLTAAQVAALVKGAGFPAAEHVTAVAVCRAESSFYVGAKNPGSSASGLFQILWSVHRKYDQRRLLTDGEYNTRAAYDIWKARRGGSWDPWVAYTSGAYKKYLTEARQGVAQASSVVGSPVTSNSGTSSTSGASRSSITYGSPGPEISAAGIGTTQTAAVQTSSPLAPFKIFGSEMWGDYSKVIIGAPTFEAGIETVPHVKFSILDPEGDLLFRHRNVFVQGARVQYADLDFRIDQVTFEPGGHGTGQLNITAIDSMAYALMNLTGPATAGGISAVTWLAAEMQRCGFDPNRYLLGEAVVSQSEISRDVADQQGSSGQGEKPSAWTTMTRLARELGKRFFISGNRIVFGSSAFAMRWCAPGSLRLTRHAVLDAGEYWQDMPTAKIVSVGSRSGVLEVSGKVPFNRALYFRPGVSVIIRNTPAIAGDAWVEMMVTSVSYTLGTDTDGADITLLQPVDPPPQPPQANPSNNGPTSSGTSVSGGGTDGQIDRFVALALAQAGDRYVFGAEASISDPDPKRFDCCLTGDMRVHTVNRGLVPIRDIEVGDLVHACDLDAQGELVARPVVAWARQRVRPIHRVSTAEGWLDATGNHPFLRATETREGWASEWVNAENLVENDLIVAIGEAMSDPQGWRDALPEPWSVRRVLSVEIVGEDESFDIQVEGAHNFVAEGLLVSNSELVEWAAGRAGITPRVPDGSAAQLAHCRSKGTLISVAQAIKTKGALLFQPGHVAISLGNGKTIEAMNPSQGVRQGNANGRGWTQGAKIPGAQGYR